MIADFLAPWALFGDAYLAGLLVAATLGTIGVWVVARDHIFLGAAVSQASALGVPAGLALAPALGWIGERALSSSLAIAASVATAWIAIRGADAQIESEESLTGWILLVAASVPVLLMAHGPHGLEEIERLLFSTLLSASRGQVLAIGLVTLATVACAWRWRDALLLSAIDPEMADAVGLRRAWTRGAVVPWLGLAVGLSIRTTGTLYAFDCLVLPALAAKHLCREMMPMLAVAPAIAVGGALVAFVLANGLDLPPAQVTVALLAVVFVAGWGRRRLRAAGGPR